MITRAAFRAAALRLLGYYSGNDYSADNPGGMSGIGGMATNWEPCIQDIGTVANGVGEVAGTITAAQSTISMVWDSTTTAADPGAGKLRATTATPASGSYSLLVSATDAAGSDIASLLAELGASSSATKARARLVQASDADKHIDLLVTGVTVVAGYRAVAVTAIGGPGGFENGAVVALGWVRTGDKGDVGGAALPAGTAAAPGLAVTGDSDTGLAQIGGADTLSVVAGGIELARIGADGLTMNPGRALIIPKWRFRGPNNAEDYEFQRKGDTGLFEFSGLQLGYSGFSFKVNNGTERLRIPSSGPVTVDGVPVGAGLYTGTSSKSANYAIVAGDGGGVIKCTAGLTITLPAASGLSAGWWVTLSNRSAGTITITPAGSDTVGGASSWTIRAWQDLTIYRTGASAFEVVNLGASVADAIATWSLTYKGSGVTLSNGNLTAACAASNSVRAAFGQSAGKRYFEVAFASVGSAGIGVQTASGGLTSVVGQDANGWAYLSDGRKYTGGAGTAYGSTYTAGAVVRIAHDIDAGKLWVAIGSTWQGGGDPVAGTNPMFTGVTGATFYPAIGDFGSSSTGTGNFLPGAFAYTPPTGYTSYY